MTGHAESISRSTFVRRMSGLFAATLLDRSSLLRLHRRPGGLEHPEPREGITAERVLATDTLGKKRSEKVVSAYDAARAYPAIFDGIACSCSCGAKTGMHRSLLVCYETMQPTGCGECQLEAALVGRLAREDKSLAEIRKAVDKEFG